MACRKNISPNATNNSQFEDALDEACCDSYPSPTNQSCGQIMCNEESIQSEVNVNITVNRPLNNFSGTKRNQEARLANCDNRVIAAVHCDEAENEYNGRRHRTPNRSLHGLACEELNPRQTRNTPSSHSRSGRQFTCNEESNQPEANVNIPGNRQLNNSSERERVQRAMANFDNMVPVSCEAKSQSNSRRPGRTPNSQEVTIDDMDFCQTDPQAGPLNNSTVYYTLAEPSISRQPAICCQIPISRPGPNHSHRSHVSEKTQSPGSVHRSTPISRPGPNHSHRPQQNICHERSHVSERAQNPGSVHPSTPISRPGSSHSHRPQPNICHERSHVSERAQTPGSDHPLTPISRLGPNHSHRSHVSEKTQSPGSLHRSTPKSRPGSNHSHRPQQDICHERSHVSERAQNPGSVLPSTPISRPGSSHSHRPQPNICHERSHVSNKAQSSGSVQPSAPISQLGPSHLYRPQQDICYERSHISERAQSPGSLHPSKPSHAKHSPSAPRANLRSTPPSHSPLLSGQSVRPPNGPPCGPSRGHSRGLSYTPPSEPSGGHSKGASTDRIKPSSMSNTSNKPSPAEERKAKKKHGIELTDEQKALCLDNYYPGLLHDAVNQNADFNEVAKRFITPDYAIDGDKTEKGMSLLEAFDTRVKVEQCTFRNLINVHLDKSKDTAPVYVPVYGPAAHPTASDMAIEEHVRAAASPVDLQQYLRTQPESDPVRAIFCLTRAQKLNDFYKEYRGAQIAASQAPPEQVEMAALHGAKSFHIENLNSESQSVDSNFFKPLELISYIGITKPN